MDNEPIQKTPFTALGAATIHPKRENVSFGRWAMPVMAEKMLDPDPVDRRRAVQSLCDYVFDSRRVATKEFQSVVPILKSIHKDENDEVRQKVAECFCAITVGAAGRRVFDKHDFYGEVLVMADDQKEEVRQAAITAVYRACLSPICVESMVKAGAIQVLVERIPKEPDATLVPLLQALHFCCLVDPDAALLLDGLDALIPLLESTCPKVRGKTGTVIKDLTVEAPGRNEALLLSAVPPLLELCLDENDRVKAKALAALMMIVNATEGKYKALEGKAIEKILPLLHSLIAEVRLNAIKVLTAVGEAPEGREILLRHYPTILRLLNDEYDEIRNAANKLVKVVTFEP